MIFWLLCIKFLLHYHLQPHLFRSRNALCSYIHNNGILQHCCRQSLLVHLYPYDTASTSGITSHLKTQPETCVEIVPSKTYENKYHMQVVKWEHVLVCYTIPTQAFYNNISYWSSQGRVFKSLFLIRQWQELRHHAVKDLKPRYGSWI